MRECGSHLSIKMADWGELERKGVHSADMNYILFGRTHGILNYITKGNVKGSFMTASITRGSLK